MNSCPPRTSSPAHTSYVILCNQFNPFMKAPAHLAKKSIHCFQRRWSQLVLQLQLIHLFPAELELENPGLSGGNNPRSSQISLVCWSIQSLEKNKRFSINGHCWECQRPSLLSIETTARTCRMPIDWGMDKYKTNHPEGSEAKKSPFSAAEARKFCFSQSASSSSSRKARECKAELGQKHLGCLYGIICYDIACFRHTPSNTQRFKPVCTILRYCTTWRTLCILLVPDWLQNLHAIRVRLQSHAWHQLKWYAVILSRSDSVRHPNFITRTGLKLFLEVHCWLQSKRVMDGSERLKDKTLLKSRGM